MMNDTKEREIDSERFAQIMALANPPGMSAASNINVNAGGIAVWLAAAACAVTMAITLVGTVFAGLMYMSLNSQMVASVSDLNRQTKDLRDADVLTQAYISAGYVTPPKETEK